MIKLIWILPFFFFAYGWNAVGHWHGGLFTGLLGLVIASAVWFLHRRKRPA